MSTLQKITLVVIVLGVCINGILAFPGFLIDLINLELISKNQIDEFVITIKLFRLDSIRYSISVICEFIMDPFIFDMFMINHNVIFYEYRKH